jgi:single-strand DNA-binding protein
MQGINKVFIVGHLGHDPELRQTAQGRAVCRLRLATTRSRQEDGRWIDETDWHDVVIWEQQAERAGRLLGKGDLCAIEGRLSPRSWQDAQGQRRRTVEVVAHRFQLVKSNRDRREQQAQQAPSPEPSPRSVAAMPNMDEPAE